MVDIVQIASVIVIADEDAGLRARLKEELEAAELTVFEAESSAACLSLCHELRPALVLLSASLDDAADVCATLKETPELKRTRVLMTLSEDDRLDEFMQAEVDDCLMKSLQPALILRRIQNALRQQALEDQVEFQSQILSQMADSVICVDGNGNVIYWNAEAENAYGLSAEEMIGQPLDNAYRIEGFTPETRKTIVSKAAQNVWRGEGVHVKQNGERSQVEVTVRALKIPQHGDGHIAVIRNISERKTIETALQEHRQLADALRDTVAALTRTLDPNGVLRLLLEHVGRVVPNKFANILLIEGDKARVGYSRGYSAEAERMLNEQWFAPYEIPTFQEMIATGEACLIPDTAQDARWEQMGKLSWVRSYLGMPIRAYDHVIGFLNLDSDEPNAFLPIHAERLRVFADQAAIAIENAQLYDAIYRDAVEMRTLHKATAFLYATNMFASDNLVDICEQIVHVVVDEFGKVDCGVLLTDEKSGELLRMARAGALVHTSHPLQLNGQGLVPASVRTGQTIYAPNVNTDSRYIPNNSSTLSELVVPLRTAKGVIGVLDLQSPELDAFAEHDIRLIEVFAERAAAAIENVKLYNENRRYTGELEQRVHERTSELNRVKERVEAILHHSSDAILLVRPNGAIQQGNRAFETTFGYNPDEAFGTDVGLLAEPTFRTALTQAVQRVAENRTSERLEIVAQRLNGFTFDADVTLSPIISGQNQITSIVCSLRDITARKRLETELRQALHKERELSELKSRFIARASHEFRTPLAVILTSSDLLRNYGARMTEEQRDEKLNRLQKEVRSMAVMLDDLLTISKGEELREFNPELIDLESLTTDVVHEIGDGIGMQHTMAVVCQGNCSNVYADRKLIERIITNLLSNAIKYSPVGSTIEVEAVCEVTRIVLRVKDQGIGIPDDDQSRLFEAFHRARNVDHISGTGLGLAIVKQAVELHGGEVSFTSQLGKGTIFTVILPNLAVKEMLS